MISAMLCLLLAQQPDAPGAGAKTNQAKADPVSQYLTDLEQSGVLAAPAEAPSLPGLKEILRAAEDDLVTVAERPVKPGAHALTLRIDIRPGKKSKDSDKLGYVSEHTFAIIVPDGKRTRVAIKGDEDGDAPEYEPEIEVELETLK